MGFSKHRGKPKWHFSLQKCHFGKGPRKGFWHSVIHKDVLCRKHYFYNVSAKHSFAEMKECKLKKNKIYQKLGVACQHAKRCFCLFVFFFVFWVLWFFSLCSCFFLEKKSPQKAIFLQLRGLSSFVPPKGLSLNPSLLTIIFFPCFPFLFLSRFHLCSLVWSISPFLENNVIGVSSLFFGLFLC